MHNNVVCLTTFSNPSNLAHIIAANDNIVSLEAYRAKARPQHTVSGVFFVTDAFVSPGDAA